MKNVYIGKASTNNPASTDICKVLYCDINTGAAIVYNRATGHYETIFRHEKRYLDPNIKKLAEDTENLFNR